MTEKDYNPKQKEKKAMARAAVADKVKKKVIKDIEGKNKVPEAVAKKEEKIAEKTAETAPEKAKEKKPEAEKAKPVEKTKPKVKKEEAVVNSYSLPISTKKAADVCRFIKGKTIEKAISELEEVAKGRKAVPMKGEIPHRKGKIMSGGFPKKTVKEMIVVLKGLAGNAAVNEIEDPVINEAIANMASRPFGRFGRVQKKRTHLKITAKEKKTKSKPRSKKK
jgi:ribosomal protein L22